MRTADHLQHSLASFVELLAESEARINELNVFPIADNDTGTNALATARSIQREAAHEPDCSLSDLAKRIASAALMSSRGNSGLILGQYLTGLSAALVEDPWPDEWLHALRAGAEQARAAVVDPHEGTILTVADKAALASGDSAPELLVDASERADKAVIQTEFQLEALTKRGVVDAGGVVLSLFLRALADIVANEPEFTIADRVVARPARRRGDASTVLAATVVGYELQFNCQVTDSIDDSRLRDLLGAFGRDVVVGSDEGLLVAHVHAKNIGPVVEAVHHLHPFNIRIEALLEQVDNV